MGFNSEFKGLSTPSFLEMYFRVAYRMNTCSGLCLPIFRLMLEGTELCLMLVPLAAWCLFFSTIHCIILRLPLPYLIKTNR